MNQRVESDCFLGVVRVHGVCHINEMEHKMNVLKKTGIHSAFDIVNVIKK